MPLLKCTWSPLRYARNEDVDWLANKKALTKMHPRYIAEGWCQSKLDLVPIKKDFFGLVMVAYCLI